MSSVTFPQSNVVGVEPWTQFTSCPLSGLSELFLLLIFGGPED